MRRQWTALVASGLAAGLLALGPPLAHADDHGPHRAERPSVAVAIAPIFVEGAPPRARARLAREVRRSLADAASEAAVALRFLDPDEVPSLDVEEGRWGDLAIDLGVDVIVRVTLVLAHDEASVRIEGFRPAAVPTLQRRDRGPVADVPALTGALLRSIVARVRGVTGEVSAAHEESERDPDRAAGRLVLAGHGAVFGAFAAATLLDAVSTATARVRYPVLLLGAAAGLATALLSHDEWPLGAHRAWLVGAAMRWGVVLGFGTGLALSNASTDRLVGGVLGGFVGMVGGAFLGRLEFGAAGVATVDTLASWGLAAGAALGVALLPELGDAAALPSVGGIALGVGAGIVLARSSPLPIRTALAVNAGAGLGAALGGGAAILAVDGSGGDVVQRERWLGVGLGLGALVGGVTGALVAMATAPEPRATPTVGTLRDGSGRSVPSLGIGGRW